MADTRLFPSVPLKRLKTDIASSDTTFKLGDIQWYVGSDGVAVNLAAADFGTVGYGVFEPNTSRQEFFTWDPTTILNYATTGISILSRGLPWSGDYTTQASSRKFGHDGGSKVLLFTNAPGFYDQFANKANDETISGLWTFTSTQKPKYNTHPTFTADEELIDKKYADDLAIAGAPNASTTVKGIVEEATVSEINAGTAAGGTAARLFVNPNTLAQSILVSRYAVDSVGTDAYAITTAGPLTAYVAGQVFRFKAGASNTGPCTLNVDGLGAIAIKKDASQDLSTDDIRLNQIVSVIYDGTNMQLIATAGPTPTGLVSAFAGVTAPTGWLLCDGSAVSRTTYAALFAVLTPTIGAFTITIAAPGVVTLNSHGLATGDSVYLTTSGALPTGLSVNTRYFVTKIDANTFKLATTLANALASSNITTSGSQSGTHTAFNCPYGVGDGSTTFTLPSLKGLVPVGKDAVQTEFAGLGQTGGEKTHVLTVAELAAHTHPETAQAGGAGGNTIATSTNAGSPTTTALVTGSAGSDTGHNNIQPYLTLNFIIKI